MRKLVSQFTPSVVHVQATGYGPVESSSGNSSGLVGMQQKIGSGVIIDPDSYIDLLLNDFRILAVGIKIVPNLRLNRVL